MKKIINTLKSYLTLDDDWDSYGGIAPTQDVVDTSIDFVKLINEKNAILPTPMVAGSGEVGLYWSNSLTDVYIEVGFENKNEFSYLVATSELEIGEDDCDVNNIPEVLMKHIKEFVN